jgi:mannose-1-phosphate guanylyltransferase/phosphomannomutase
MIAVVMAGGQGMRLHPLTCLQPKPMLPIFGRPLLLHILDKLKEHGFRRLVMALHYRPGAIMDYFGDGADRGLQIGYALEDKPLGTAGCVRHAALNPGEAVLVISGDLLFSFDFAPALSFHRRKGALVTMLLLPYHAEPWGLGIAALDQDGRVLRYLEKPAGPQDVFSRLINTGIYILEPEALNLIPPATYFDFSRDLFPLLLKKALPFFGYVTEGYWSDLGTLDLYRQAHEQVFAGNGGVTIPGEEIASGIWAEEGIKIAPGAVLRPPLFLGARSCMEEGAAAGPAAVIGAGTVLGRGASVVRSILGQDNRIGEKTVLADALLADANIIEEHCCLRDGVVLGGYCHVSAHSTLQRNVKVWPRHHLPSHSFLEGITLDGEPER